MEINENYICQYQDLCVEDGIVYGDIFDGVNFDYVVKFIGFNVVLFVVMVWVFNLFVNVEIVGVVQFFIIFKWDVLEIE